MAAPAGRRRPIDLQTNLTFSARWPGVIAGLDVATLAFRLVDLAIKIEVHRLDGSDVATGEQPMGSIALLHQFAASFDPCVLKRTDQSTPHFA
ncbi:hypothetical protein NKJ72_30565 [Mesorhizobium sp. M0045]|uniref:hypothetical protein n=1 Tax=Mesorhizobium sp. M0045 TaxID=2956857 RepID=UPI003335630C